MKRTGFLTAIVFLACAVAVTSAVAAETVQRTISVSGEGRAEAVPDMATIRLGVTSEAEEAGEAMAETSEAVAGILARLTDLGLDGRDIQTQRISLNPLWSNGSYSSGSKTRISGFAASNIIMVRVRDLDRIGGILDVVTKVGANEFNGLRFEVEDPEPLMAAARKAAVADAMATARLLAEAAGVSLGPVLTMSEHGGRPQPMMMEQAAARSAAVPVAPGEVTVSTSVSMVFAIAN